MPTRQFLKSPVVLLKFFLCEGALDVKWYQLICPAKFEYVSQQFAVVIFRHAYLRTTDIRQAITRRPCSTVEWVDF
jgi:hypothetical protein